MNPLEGNRYRIVVFLSTIQSRDLSTVVTGINAIQTNSDDNNDAPVYSISGQRVFIPQKGIHITHGHKILVKSFSPMQTWTRIVRSTSQMP